MKGGEMEECLGVNVRLVVRVIEWVVIWKSERVVGAISYMFV